MLETIVEAIEKERIWQDKLHPNFPSDNAQRYLILAEEFLELAREIQDQDTWDLRDELVQVAAVAIRWLEAMDDQKVTK